MNRLVVFTLALVLGLSVSASSLLAAGPTKTQTKKQIGTRTQTQTQTQTKLQTELKTQLQTQTQTKSQTQTRTQSQTGDCPQNSYQYRSGNAYQGDLPEDEWQWFQFMWQFFGGVE